MSRRPIGGLVLAAGAGTRFGGPKQLADLRGRPLLEHALDAQRAVPAIERIVLVLGARAGEIRAALELEDVEVVVAEDWAEGQAASLRAGVRALAGCAAVIVTLGDQPFVSPQVIAAAVDAVDSPAPAWRATYRGAPGHPVMLKRALFAAIAGLRGDQGARDLLVTVGARTFECGHLARADDIDTPADLIAAAGAKVPTTSPGA